MTRNKNKKPRSPPNQEPNSDRNGEPGRGGRGRGRGGRGGRGGGVNDSGKMDDILRWRDGFRGGSPSGSNSRGGAHPFAFDHGFGGRGRGRGRGDWVGRGRGFRGADLGGFMGNFHSGRPAYHPMDRVDFEVQQWDEPLQSGQNTPGGRGRGSPLKPNGNNPPRGRGGRGGFTQKLPPTSSLSSLWYEERPLLRPIKFARSVETATLFQEAEELLEPTVQNPDEITESHAPTADKVSQVFSNTHPRLFENSLLEIEEGIEEVNFEDLALVHERILDSVPAITTAPVVREEVFTGIIRKPAPGPSVQPEETLGAALVTTETTIRAEIDAATPADVELSEGLVIKPEIEATPLTTSAQDELMAVETQPIMTTPEAGPMTIQKKPSPLFVIDTDPSTSQKQIPVPAYGVHPHTAALGEGVKVEVEPDSEDDVIVYDAPNPRVSTPKVELTTLTNISLPNHTPSSTPRQINPLRRGKFVHVVGRNAKRGSGGVTGVKRKRLAEHESFAKFGAMIAEAGIRSQDGRKGKDPKEHLRRQGDSDIDWGDETDEENGEGGPTVATAEGMDLDPDLVGSGVTIAAMERFVEGINGNHVTMDDLEDVNAEEEASSDEMDEEEDEGGTDDEDMESDEEMMLIEPFLASQDGSDFSDGDEDELNPRAGFQARLDRLRKKQQKMIEMWNGEAEDEMDLDFDWGEGEDIDDFVDGALGKYEKNRVARNAIFRAIQDGAFDELQPKASSSKRKDLPPELQEQWEKDRLKKAKRKSERELARLEAAVDPLVTKTGGKKSKKAMIAAAKLDPSIEIPHRIVDMVSVEQQIRRFLANKEKNDMALPACGRSTRKKIHNLAALFNLKSKSEDGALGRYTTLFKTKHSGKNIDEQKVARMIEGFKHRALYDVSDDDWDDRGKGKGKGKSKGKGKDKGKNKGKDKGKSKEKDQSGHLRTKEGDVVGHAAPKIDETNIGFMMLASMGWSDGAAIGLSGGLDAPITAVIKKTKLGLGVGPSAKSS